MEGYIKISFKNCEPNGLLCATKSGRKSMECTVSDGEINFSIYYDFNDKPLSLKSKIQNGDAVEIILMPFRIELWINSALQDEEWPAGKCLFDKDNDITGNINADISDYEYKEKTMPSVLGTFENANGWRPEENVFVGDCMPYVNDNRYHVLYLKDRHHHKSKWGLGAHQWEHISTADFNTWSIHPMAIEIRQPYEGSVCTGSWIKKDDIQYLFYTIRTIDKTPSPILRCVSKDGYHFERDNDFSFVLSNKYMAESARDPKVILADDGVYHMFVTSSLSAEVKGCLVHLISKDLNVWEELENPIYISDTSEQPECPDYFEYNGYYYLIFSLKGEAHYMLSKSPFDNWEIPENPIIPCNSVPKCAVWNDEIVFTGFDIIEKYAGNMVFKSATNDENGRLIFK